MQTALCTSGSEADSISRRRWPAATSADHTTITEGEDSYDPDKAMLWDQDSDDPDKAMLWDQESDDPDKAMLWAAC